MGGFLPGPRWEFVASRLVGYPSLCKLLKRISNEREVERTAVENQRKGLRCLGPTITPERILELRQRVAAHEDRLEELRGVWYALSGRIRLRILYLLSDEPELCVCDLSDILDESISAVSHQLRVLREHGLVRSRREGKTVFYALSGPWVRELLDGLPAWRRTVAA